MGGKASRDKGCRGEVEARALLAERDFAIIETSRGRSVEDIIAEKDGKRFAVEVKNTATLTIADFRRQAKAQAKARGCAWMLMWRVEGYPHTFYVEGTDREPCVWRGRSS